MTFLHREMTNLQNMEDAQKRKYALLRFYEIFVLAKSRATKKVYQEILPQIRLGGSMPAWARPRAPMAAQGRWGSFRVARSWGGTVGDRGWPQPKPRDRIRISATEF